MQFVLFFDTILLVLELLCSIKLFFPMHTLNTENPDQLIYNNTLLQLTVLGGVRLDSLDRMRVTLKVEIPESPRPPLRHNLDLYNDIQTEKFIRKIAERLEVGTSVASASLSELTEKLEQEEAFLKAQNLRERTNDLIGNSGIWGEETNGLILYVFFTSRKRAQP